jgi:hypothetical protein
MQEAYPGLSTWQSRLSISPLEKPGGATNVSRSRLTVYAPNLEWPEALVFMS